LIFICNNLEKERSIAVSLKMVSLLLGKIFLGQDMDIASIFTWCDANIVI
jgi:hypothetical protein